MTNCTTQEEMSSRRWTSEG